MYPVIWSLNMKTACKTFFQTFNKRVGPSFALVSRLHCAGSCIPLVLFTWVISFEFGVKMCMCKVTRMLSVSFAYYVGLFCFVFPICWCISVTVGIKVIVNQSWLLLLLACVTLVFFARLKSSRSSPSNLSQLCNCTLQCNHLSPDCENSSSLWKTPFVLSFSSSHCWQSRQLCRYILSHASLSWFLPYCVV